MKLTFTLTSLVCLLITASMSFAQETEFKSIFDGNSLDGWRGDTEVWRVEDGAIVGETTADKTIKQNTFLVWDEGELDDFVLRLKFRISGTDRANSGIQVRSSQADNGALAGYQADIDRSGKFIGIVYDERGRGILAQRGQKATIDKEGKKKNESIGKADELLTHINMDDWNEYVVTAKGNQITTQINGKTMSQVIDDQPDHFDRKGLLGLQLHVGPPMKIEFKDIELQRLPLANDQKKVVFIAGKPSHGRGQHEHNAGCLLMAECLDQAASKDELPVVTKVYQNGWPDDPTALDNADTVVVYCDGGGRHYLHAHGEEFEEIMRKGVGLVCIHYGVEVPKGMSGQRFLQWIGGYFETDWSVNPHWVAKFESLPKHPVTQGVQPFEINDEWYYHMRFSPEMSRVTPILSALPSADTLKRKDGPHSGNPAVRKAVLEDKQPQHLAWAFVRGDGVGRGFGFTGGHFHSNWQNDDFRKLVLNAIVWSAKVDVPGNGVASQTPSDEAMENNQDTPKRAPKKNANPKKQKK
ncbi:MAG: DUF1080 domain-containing protein [Mariniblastus sp.]|nr:DUF1080 domain-containing protein [Mariniblastus sp.]